MFYFDIIILKDILSAIMLFLYPHRFRRRGYWSILFQKKVEELSPLIFIEFLQIFLTF
jgi:hypothetical protein